MEGLEFKGFIPERVTREQFVILRDEPVYQLVQQFASKADMQEIDGWARSFYTLEGHLESILQYQKPLLPEPTDPMWLEAKREVQNEFIRTVPKVNTFNFESEINRVKFEASSAAGYGYQGKKGENENFKKARSIANALVRTYHERCQRNEKDIANASLINDGNPDVAFTRTQLAKLPSIKVRNVYGEAFHYILIEGLSAYPLLNVLKSVDSFYLTGKDPTTYVPRYLDRLDDGTGWFLSLDWKSFDATVQLWEIDHAFKCIENVLMFPNDLSRAAFEVSKYCFKHRKLAAPDGKLWIRHGGIPSGSYYTNIVGSLINYTRIKFLLKKLGREIVSVRVQGDDSIIKLTGEERPDISYMQDIATIYGWILNGPKCSAAKRGDEVTFLGRSHLQLLNIRERLKVLRLMCFPEYEVDDPKISTTRVTMIATDAGLRDPLYNLIISGMHNRYGASATIPRHLMTFTETSEFQDVVM